MSFRTLPPVGEKVILEGAEPPPEFTGFAALWTQSGTAALALAIQAAMAARPDVTSPEVLLPAYGCPDLVAAALYAGATPVLADVSREDPAYSVDALERGWTESVVAIVAVNFLGIREHVGRLAAFSRERNAWLIEDCAQWYPEAPESEPLSPAQAVVLSFGRGKPVSLLGGGALLLREGESSSLPSMLQPKPEGRFYSLKCGVYNRLLHPRVYPLAARNPMLRLGITRFHPLESVQAMDGRRRSLITPNVRAHLSRSRWREQALNDVFSGHARVAHPLGVEPVQRKGRLLRFPLLCRDSRTRDAVLRDLTRAGLGASALYGVPLAQVPGLPSGAVRATRAPTAEDFAARLLTLPVHSGVSRADIDQMAEYFV